MQYTTMQDEIAEIIPNLYIGSLKAAKNFDYLRNKGFVHVINLSSFPVHYTGTSPTINNMYGIFDYYHTIPQLVWLLNRLKPCIDEIHNNMSRGNVLVNCHAGVNRSALLIGVYLRVNKEYPSDKTICLLTEANQKRGIQVLTNKSFREVIYI